jgi:hypothetical protein
MAIAATERRKFVARSPEISSCFPMLRLVVLTLGMAMTALLLQGCAALPIAALGGAMLQSGAGAVVKTGTEYTTTGAAHRTFMVPMNAVRAAVLEAFDRAGVRVDEAEQQPDDEDRITAKLKHRTISVRLTAFSPSLTGMTLVVKRNALIKDRATSSELLEQVEQVLSENPTFARSLHRPPQDGAAASPGLPRAYPF